MNGEKLKLTVLGSYGGFPNKAGACMGNLISNGTTNIVVDFGSGSAVNLQKHIEISSISAIILSHHHFDHMSDILVLRYAIEIGIARTKTLKPIDVYCPFDPPESLNLLKSPAFNLIRIKDGGKTVIGGINISFKKTKHNKETYASVFNHLDKKIGYTSDTGYSEDLIPFFNNCDLLIGEASLLKNQKANTPYHMTTEEAVMLANKAKVKKLLLTHFWYEFDKNIFLNEALQSNPQCELELAEEENVYLV